MEGFQSSDSEARKYVWMGSIPLQISLHQSEVTSVPPPPPVLVLASRNGYLPLLIPVIKSQFQNSLPPGTDTVWFDYRGLPLKWNIPTGVLFDLLCAEPERPWNLTVHFRSYPTSLLIPCAGEESVKWGFINSLKEASYILNGNTRNVMKMSESDQRELWRCVAESDMDGYSKVSVKLRPGTVTEDTAPGTSSERGLTHVLHNESEFLQITRTGKIPFRLYLRYLENGIDDLSDAQPARSWDEVTYINRPVEVAKDEDINWNSEFQSLHAASYFSLGNALAQLLPLLFPNSHIRREGDAIAHSGTVLEGKTAESMEYSALGQECNNVNPLPPLKTDDSMRASDLSIPQTSSCPQYNTTAIEGNPESPSKQNVKIIRIQGIEPSLDLPLQWVAKNLSHPENFIHVCIYILNAKVI